MSKISDFVQKALVDNTYNEEYEFGVINNRLCQRIAVETGTKVLRNAVTIITCSAIRHAFVRHGKNDEKERGQLAIKPEDFEFIYETTRNPDKIERGDRQGRKRDDIIIFSKKLNGKNYFVLMNADRGKNPISLYFNTLFIKN